MSLYQIKDWDAHFENSKSREYKTCSFVCVPNKQHGLSFSKIMAEKDGAMIYGIWCLILGACSQQKKRDGWLTVDGQQTGSPWTVEDLALKFRRPKSEIERSLQVFVSQEIAWIISHDCPSTARVLPVDCTDGIRKRRERIEENEGKEGNQEVANAPLTINLSKKNVVPRVGYILPDNLKTPEFKKTWSEWVEFRMKKKACKDWNSMFRLQLEALSGWGEAGAIKSLKDSMMNDWQGVFAPKGILTPKPASEIRPSYADLQNQGVVK